MRRIFTLCLACLTMGMLTAEPTRADPPVSMYMFPAGAQRGARVTVRVGGLYFHQRPRFHLAGPGVTGPQRLSATETTWFEGPVIPLPDSQAAEDYPRDYLAELQIDQAAAGWTRTWRVSTAQGITQARPFLIGDHPELVEEETDGRPLPVPVTLPLTINGRIFPREDVDLYTFDATAGETYTCSGLAGSLGSPLDLRLQVLGPDGRLLAENDPLPPPGLDTQVRFTARQAGRHSLRVHDARFGGLQHFVYRLTLQAGPCLDRVFPLGGRRESSTRFEPLGVGLAAPLLETSLPAVEGRRTLVGFSTDSLRFRPLPLDVSDLPEHREEVGRPENSPATAALNPPFVGNGRIEHPGESDRWVVQLEKGAAVDLSLRAARLGSPLDGVLAVLAADGRELARNDDAGPGQADPQLNFTAPETALYTVTVADRDPARGGPLFAYRLVAAPAPQSGFRLTLPADSVAVVRGGEAKIKLKVERLGGYEPAIELRLDPAPPGLTLQSTTIPAKAGEFELVFKAAADAPLNSHPVALRGLGEGQAETTAHTTTGLAGTFAGTVSEPFWLTTTLATPFKVKGVYEIKYAQRGAQLVRRFTLDRGGYDGPLRVRLADRQNRHLQGVSGPVVEVPAGQSEFEYPVFLPPWMEIGRTSRSVVMATADLDDGTGERQTVSFTSQAQNEQIVALIDPGQLSLDLPGGKSLLAPP
ncbi:MAG: PPC domain-containing protein [Planctomycetaceae bacterium]